MYQQSKSGDRLQGRYFHGFPDRAFHRSRHRVPILDAHRRNGSGGLPRVSFDHGRHALGCSWRNFCSQSAESATSDTKSILFPLPSLSRYRSPSSPRSCSRSEVPHRRPVPQEWDHSAARTLFAGKLRRSAIQPPGGRSPFAWLCSWNCPLSCLSARRVPPRTMAPNAHSEQAGASVVTE
jgi:hypothetical protein